MPLPRSLVQPFRQGQLTVGSGWRAFFAPFNNQLAVSQSSTSLGPTIYDLLVSGKLIDTVLQPVSGWFDLGWVKNFKFTPGSKIGNVSSGYRGAIRAKYRAETGEKFSMDFAEYTRTALTIASGSQVFNCIATTVSTPSTSGPLSSSGTTAIAMGASGYVASGSVTNYVGSPTLYVPAGSGALFPAGSYIVCDQDYNGTSFGFVGDAGANVFQGAVTSVDFIRMTSDYVAGVVAVVTGGGGGDALILSNPFIGGGNAPLGTTPNTAPTAGAKVQKILGYVTREGGTFIKEWSALVVMDTMDRNQILFYYPRVAPDEFGGYNTANLQNATALQQSDLTASFDALAFDDPLDGETVVRYAAYYPAPGLSIQI